MSAFGPEAFQRGLDGLERHLRSVEGGAFVYIFGRSTTNQGLQRAGCDARRVPRSRVPPGEGAGPRSGPQLLREMDSVPRRGNDRALRRN